MTHANRRWAPWPSRFSLAAGAGPSASPAASQTGSQTASHTAAQPPADAGFRGDTLPPSVVYKTVDGHALRLFIRRPRAVLSGPRPTVVLFHGGAWRTGGAGRLDALAQELAGQGLVALLVEYRLLPAQERLRVSHEAIADARSAMRYVRQHAVALGGDPDRMAAGGVSAGGHLAMMTALLPALSPDFDADGDNLGASPRPARRRCVCVRPSHLESCRRAGKDGVHVT